MFILLSCHFKNEGKTIFADSHLSWFISHMNISFRKRLSMWAESALLRVHHSVCFVIPTLLAASPYYSYLPQNPAMWTQLLLNTWGRMRPAEITVPEQGLGAQGVFCSFSEDMQEQTSIFSWFVFQKWSHKLGWKFLPCYKVFQKSLGKLELKDKPISKPLQSLLISVFIFLLRFQISHPISKSILNFGFGENHFKHFS